MKRIFAAIDISNQARTKISEYIETLQSEFCDLRVGWEKAEKLHITMKFFGDVEIQKTRLLLKAFEKIAKQFTPFNLKILKTGVFPSLRNARILWLGIEDEKGSLKKLNSILESKCEKLGFKKEKRDFKPHLTIARLREPHKSKVLAEKHLDCKFESAEFPVGEIVIYESKLLAAGSVYSVLSKHSFGNTH